MMRLAITVFLLTLATGGLAAAQAQQQAPPAVGEKSTSKSPNAAADDKAAPGNSASQDVPAKKASEVDNPFPEEQSKSAAKGAEAGHPPPVPADLAGDTPPSEGRRDASPSEDGVSSSRTRLEGLDDRDPDASRKVRTSVAEPMINSKLSTEDVAIGKMYFQSDNYRGAYLRYKEALSLDPENPDAAFGLAETARKLNQMEEAVKNYKLCVDLDPDGPRAKTARKALVALSSKSAR